MSFRPPPTCGGELRLQGPRVGRSRRAQLALGAPLALLRSDGLDRLGVGHAPHCLLRMLGPSWGVTQPDAMRERIRGLFEAGHEERFQRWRAVRDASPFRREHERRHGEVRSIRAWDLGRAVCLARWGFTLEWFDDAEAWDWIEEASRSAQEDYAGWRAYLRSYYAGHDFWAKCELDRDEDEVIAYLLAPGSPLEDLPWSPPRPSGRLITKRSKPKP